MSLVWFVFFFRFFSCECCMLDEGQGGNVIDVWFEVCRRKSVN